MAALLALLLADALPAQLEALRDANRAVREQAVAHLAAGGPASRELAAYVGHADRRVAAGTAEALRRRGAVDALGDLARLADRDDAELAQLAADTCVAIALARRVPLADVHFDGMGLLPRRLEAAVGAAVEAHVAKLRGDASAETPHLYRALYACGDYGAGPLERIAGDTGRAGRLRAHALHAHARLTGDASLAHALLDDAEPDVRCQAASLVLRYGPEAGLEALAARLGAGRTLAAGERACAVAAAARLGRLGEDGVRALERIVARDGPFYESLSAAAALHAVDPARAGPAVRARVDRLLELDRSHPGAGVGVALYALRCGPLGADLEARVASSPCPLLPAAVEADRSRALALLRPHLARHAGSREGLRVQAVAALLERHDAPPEDRVAFAAGTFREDAAGFAAYGLLALRPVPAPAWAAQRARVEAALEDSGESTRLAAAELLLPDARAIGVCLDALWDGDPWGGARAARLLADACPDLPRVPADATAAERRRIAYALRTAPVPTDEG